MTKFAELMEARDALKQDRDKTMAFLEEVLAALEEQQNHHIEDEDKQVLTIDPERTWEKGLATAKIRMALPEGFEPKVLEATVRLERRAESDKGEWTIGLANGPAGIAQHGHGGASVVLTQLARKIHEMRGVQQVRRS